MPLLPPPEDSALHPVHVTDDIAVTAVVAAVPWVVAKVLYKVASVPDVGVIV